MRIVSLLPSATEVICALDLESQLVGVTHECDFPPTVCEKPKVTRTHIPTAAASAEIDRLVREELSGERRALYSLDHQRMRELRPDLIVTQTLCDVCAVNDADVRKFLDTVRLEGVVPRIIYLEPRRLRDVFTNILEVAAAAEVAGRAQSLLARLIARVEAVARRAGCDAEAFIGAPSDGASVVGSHAREGRPRVVVLEWLDPPFSCGHWTPELVALAGAREPLAAAGERSRQLTVAELVAADPDLIVIACCGFAVERTLQDVPLLLREPRIAGMRCVRAGRVYVADGSAYFSRPGPRLVDSLEILANAIDPQRHALRADVPAAVPAFAETAV